MKQFICSIKNNKKKGFTLTEILVVVMVVAVLAAISYPLYTKAATKSRAIEAINLLEMVRNKQLSKYARDKAYYTTATGLGQLTSNSKHETLSGAVLQVKDYTISLNSVKNCATAAYSKGNTNFSFSSGYDTAGLGCTGDVCSSFGNIVGTAKDVCNCGSKSCSNGYTLNEDTCNCDCLLGCDQGGTCYVPYGGGSTRPCSSGCGTENSANSCNGAVWSGTCWSPTQTQPTSQGCGNSGTQTRTCTPSCGGGSCGSWGACTGQTCPVSTKPATSQACGNCGSQTRTVTCNTNTGGWTTGSWGTCSGQGICAVGATQACNSTGTQTCSSSCTWGTCSVINCDNATKPVASQACGNCNTGTQTRTVTCNTSNGTWTSSAWTTCTGGRVCKSGETQTCNSTGTQTCSSSCAWGTCSVINCDTATKPATSQACGNCNTGTQTRTVTCNTSNGTWTSGTWGTCTGGGVCKSGETQTCNSTGTQTCSSSCTWGTCSVQTCSESTKPTTTQACGNCNTGTQTRTVTCNTSTGAWTSGTWTTCTGGGVCKSGETQTCNSTGTQTCSSSCSWGTCSVQPCAESTKPTTSEACGNCNTGTRTRTVTCNTSTGTWTSGTWSTCTGGGVCKSGETQTCNSTGTQTCSSSCTWGACSVVNCNASTKPATSQSCGNCNKGTQIRDVICNTSNGTWTTFDWEPCIGDGTCKPGATQACGAHAQQTCTSSCTWGTCVGSCAQAQKPVDTQACGNCNLGTQTRTVTCDTSTYTWTTTAWSSCLGGGACYVGQTQSCGGGNGTQTCSSSCGWGSCVCKTGYTWNGTTCALSSCDPSTKPNYSSKCGCGDLQYTYVCDTATLTWKVASTECVNTHSCSDPNQTRSCGGGNGTQKCGSSCEWSNPLACVCNTGYTWNGSTCVAQCTGCTPGETQTIIPSAPYGVAGTKTCTSSCTWQVSCPTNSQWNSTYNSCISRHPAGHQVMSWSCGSYTEASTCTTAHCLTTGVSGCNVPGQNTACTGSVSCAATAVSRANYDCTVYPYEVLSVTAVKQSDGRYVCDCKYNVYNVYCTYDPTISY